MDAGLAAALPIILVLGAVFFAFSNGDVLFDGFAELCFIAYLVDSGYIKV